MLPQDRTGLRVPFDGLLGRERRAAYGHDRTSPRGVLKKHTHEENNNMTEWIFQFDRRIFGLGGLVEKKEKSKDEKGGREEGANCNCH